MVRVLFLLLLICAPGCSARRTSLRPNAEAVSAPIAADVKASPALARLRPVEPAPALFIPGKTGDAPSTITVAPPPTLHFRPFEDGPPPFRGTSAAPKPQAPPPPPPPPRFPGTPPHKPPLPDLPPLPPPSSDPPVVPPPAASETPLRDLHAKALKRYESMDSYMMRMRRREVIGGAARPEEIMLCKLRKEPFSVYFKWLGTEGKGREVTYVQGQHGNLLHSLTATGDVLFLPGGKRFKVAPDSVLVRSKSRYPVTEAGMGPLIARFGRLVEALERGDAKEGTGIYLGEIKRPEYDAKLLAVKQTLPAKMDAQLPRGGERLWFFDPALNLPVLVITHDDTGREVEYYLHDRFLIPANLTDDDFNPEMLWRGEEKER